MALARRRRPSAAPDALAGAQRSARSGRTRSRPDRSRHGRGRPGRPRSGLYLSRLFTRSRPRPSLMRSAPLPVLTRSPPGPAETRSAPAPVLTRSAPPRLQTRSRPPPETMRSARLEPRITSLPGVPPGEPAVRRGDDRRRPAETAGGDRVADRHRGRDAGCARKSRTRPRAPARSPRRPRHRFRRSRPRVDRRRPGRPGRPHTARHRRLRRRHPWWCCRRRRDRGRRRHPSAQRSRPRSSRGCRLCRRRRPRWPCPAHPRAGAAGVVDIRAHVPAPCPGLSGCAPGTADLVAGDPATDERGCAGCLRRHPRPAGVDPG